MPVRTALLLAVAAVLALPPAAHGAIAGAEQIAGDDIVFSADPGEANRLTVTGHGAGVVTLEDTAAPVAAGERCTQETPNRVRCERFSFVIVDLGDGDDEVTTAGEIGDPGQENLVILEGHQGADTLRGEVGRTTLRGGTGSDRLIGGPLTQGIDAVDVVRRGDFTEMPDHNRERDEVTCAEPTAGGFPTPTRVDVTDVVNGPCPERHVFLEDFVLIEGTEGPDRLTAAGEPSRVFGLGGDDVLSGEPGDRVDGGEGDDRILSQGLALGGSGDDRVDAGAHYFSFTPPRLDGQSGDDLVLGSSVGDRLAGGTGSDSISGRDGGDVIRVRDGVRDKVRCGDGRDRVSADRRDSVASDCELVSRG